MTQRTASRGRGALTESHEETSRLLEVGANRTRDAAPAVAPPARLRLAIDRSQALVECGELGSGALRNSNGKLSSCWLLRRGPTCHGRFKLGPIVFGL